MFLHTMSFWLRAKQINIIDIGCQDLEEEGLPKRNSTITTLEDLKSKPGNKARIMVTIPEDSALNRYSLPITDPYFPQIHTHTYTYMFKPSSSIPI